MNTTRTEAVHRTLCAHLHIAGEGNLPELHRQALSELITANGVATQKLLALALCGLVLRRDSEKKVTAAEITLPARADKKKRLAELASAPVARAPDTDRKIYEGNSYRIVEFFPETGMFTVRVLERYPAVIGGKPKELTDKLPANFLQAVFTSFLALPFSGMPDMVVKPALKQTAEQILSYVLLTAGETQDAEQPNAADRHPASALASWQGGLAELTRRTEPMQYVRTKDVERFAEDDPRGERVINVTPEWIAFARSPFPARLPLKITPDCCAVFRCRTEGRAKDPDRLYLALDMFDGAGEETPIGKLASCEKLFWWRRHIPEFRPLPFWEGYRLRPARKLLMVPLEYDWRNTKGNVRAGGGAPRQKGRFEDGLTAPRKICLVTLKEVRNTRRGRKNIARERRLAPGERLWRADFATSADVVVPPWSGRILGIHFSDDPVIAWALVDRVGAVLEEGTLAGNPILAAALDEKEKIERLQRRGKWVDRRFSEPIKTRTHVLARAIAELAVEKQAWLAIEEITWVKKRSGEAAANRRFSMWNYARLATLIGWLGLDIATRGAPHPAPLAATVSDYLGKYTCPACGACRKAKQDKETADTWREGNVLHCRKCGRKGPIPDGFVARLVALRGLEVALKREARQASK